MSVSKWVTGAEDVLLTIFTVYLFFLYFGIFFQRTQKKIRVLMGITALVFWQLGNSVIVYTLPPIWNVVVGGVFTLFAVANIFAGNFGMKCFFAAMFDALWMLSETLVGDLLMIYGANIMKVQGVGSVMSKLFFFMIIVVLKKVFTNEKIIGLSLWHSILILLIPTGSVYIMNVVFMLAYQSEWVYAESYLLVSIVILLFVNVLIFYIYIKLADDLQIRRMNLVYEQQLDLCERHQKETEFSVQQIRDVRHNMKNHLLSILAYAQKRESEKLIKYVTDIIEDSQLKSSGIVNTGNIVTDSLVAYWQKTAESKEIVFLPELSIPMEMPFRGADISLIIGNLLENAVEGADKAEGKKYIRLNMKYDRNNLLVTVENSYKGVLVKGKDGELRTTKADASNHGIGLSSVRRAAEKYQGAVIIDDTLPEQFLVRVVLYGR